MNAAIRDDQAAIAVHVTTVPHESGQATEFVDFRQRGNNGGNEISIFASLDRQQELAEAWLAAILDAKQSKLDAKQRKAKAGA